MNGVLSNYLENKLIDLVMAETAYTPPATVYIGLLSAQPSDTGATEVVYGGYARKAISFAAASSRSIAQSALVTFDECTSGSATATHYGLFDAASGGNLLAYGALSASKFISAGTTPSIGSGQVVLTFTGGISNYLGNKLLDHAFRNTAYTPPTDRYLAFCTADINAADSAITEPSGNNYSRKTSGTWTIAAGAATNAADETFAAPSGSWGALAAVAVMDAVSVGNILFFDNAPTGQGQVPTAGDTVRFLAGAFSCSLA